MHLSIAIPEAQIVDAPTLLKLIRMAPVCDAEADEEGAEYVAYFGDFPTSVGIVARMIEEAWDLRDVHIALEGRLVVSRRKQSALIEDVMSDRACLTAGLFAHAVWDCRAITALLRLRVSSGKWHAGRKWTGVRTCISRRWTYEWSVEGRTNQITRMRSDIVS